LLETERLVLSGEGSDLKGEQEKIMILNHKEAISYLVHNAFRIDISEQTVRTLHYLLADGLVVARSAGHLRDYGFRIGGSVYLPFEDKNNLQLRFDTLLTKASLITDPYEQSFFLLIHLSYLQAFCDVNKRVSRLSCNIPLIKKNLFPLSFNSVDKDNYNCAMIAVYEFQALGPLLDLYLYSYRITSKLYDNTAQAIGFDERRARTRTQRRQLLRNIILKELTGQELLNTIEKESSLLVDEHDRQFFIEAMKEELEYLDSARIAGLGISSEAFEQWRAKRMKESN
jgi:Fic family protein